MTAQIEVNTFHFVPTECNLCGETKSKERYTISKFKQGELHYVTCDNCGTAYQNPMPDQASMQAFYHSQNFFNCTSTGDELTGYRDYDAEEATRQANARKRLKEIEALFPKGKKLRLLKVACGYGTLVNLAQTKGHDAQGIDFSETMVEGAKQRYGIDLIHDDFLTHDFGDETFDVILLYGAINNFLRPLDVARRAFSLLNPGGLYVVNHVWLNSFPERLMGQRYWIYRPPILGLFPRQAFIDYHLKQGFALAQAKRDVQYMTFDKFFGYLQFRPLIRLADMLRISRLGFTIPVPGYDRVFLRKPDEST